MKIPYPLVTSKKPFFYVTVTGVDLSAIVTTGDTKLQVYRVWRENRGTDQPLASTDLNMPPDYISQYNVPPYYSGQSNQPIQAISYTPLEQKKNKFTFVFDSNLFALAGGRYRADFYYKGVYISSTLFVYNKQSVQVAGSINV